MTFKLYLTIYPREIYYLEIGMTNYSSNTTTALICKLGIFNQIMLQKSLDFSLIEDARKILIFDKYLAWLLHKTTTFNRL